MNKSCEGRSRSRKRVSSSDLLCVSALLVESNSIARLIASCRPERKKERLFARNGVVNLSSCRSILSAEFCVRSLYNPSFSPPLPDGHDPALLLRRDRRLRESYFREDGVACIETLFDAELLGAMVVTEHDRLLAEVDTRIASLERREQLYLAGMVDGRGGQQEYSKQGYRGLLGKGRLDHQHGLCDGIFADQKCLPPPRLRERLKSRRRRRQPCSSGAKSWLTEIDD